MDFTYNLHCQKSSTAHVQPRICVAVSLSSAGPTVWKASGGSSVGKSPSSSCSLEWSDIPVWTLTLAHLRREASSCHA